MKLLLDNNLSFKLVTTLAADFPGTNHIRELLRVDSNDEQIWNHAKANEFIILTKDNDFDERSQVDGCPPKVIHLICGNQTTSFILQLLISNKEEIKLFGEKDSENCLLKIG